ncbi:6-phosphogluconolactonase [Marinobacter sp. JSM 1782161]|uniref:6-phosphogluconolactonase n=1 Tax=Marinobacter sp. JSM 1782161 TaxID=2685906 RepID=UPI001D18CA36|nr:6-phosphogluconolactonase [Marinobacter sp. JSM 1782161]
MPEIDWPATVEPALGENPDAVAAELADRVAERLEGALAGRDRASLALSGGSTPKPFFEKLRDKPLDWSRVDVTLVDERWVTPDSPDSNEKLLREHFLQGAASAARFVPMKQKHESANAGQPLAEEALADIAWPLDVLILGMGNDGHTASLFPDAPEIDRALDPSQPYRCMALHPVSQPQARLSLTRTILEQASWTALHLKGEDKLETLKVALSDMPSVREMPIRVFLSTGLTLFWSP